MDKHMPPQQEYQQMVEKASKNSPSYKNIPIAFLIGGLICALGEGLLHLYTHLGLTTDWAGSLVSITLIALSALLTGLGIYDKIAKVGGAGTLVPITGFANAMVSPALVFEPEGLVMGTGAKLFVIAGPVIVYGITASWVYGIIAWFLGQGGM